MKKISDWFLIIAIILCVLSCSSFTFVTAKHKSKNNNANNNIQIEQKVDWSKINISCLGDSITRGAYITYSYPTLLKNELGAVAVNNYGISGNTLARNHSNYDTAMCVRYTNIAKNSDIIIVMGGVNDRGSIPLGTINDTDITTFYGALNALCSGLKESYPNAWVFFMTNFKYDDVDTTNSYDTKYQDYYVNATKAVCAKHNVSVFDTFNLVNFNQSSNTTDGVHPKQEFVGNTWVPAIAQYIKANYKQK